MEINVIEYANPGHFTLLDSVARIFSVDPKNEIRLHLAARHRAGGEKLRTRLNRQNIKLEPFEQWNGPTGLKIIITPDYQLDITYKLVSEGGPVWMFIHNIDDWFELGIKRVLRQIKDALIKDKNPLLAYYLTKRAIRGNRLRKTITQAIIRNKDSRFVVLNKDLKESLSTYVSSGKVQIIPFSLFDPDIQDLSQQNVRIRVCIPGILSQKRRDYLGVFKLIESLPEEVKNKLEFDLLGGISRSSADMSQLVVDAAKSLIGKGYHILLREKEYIDLEEFDHELGKADIILGNLNLDQGGGSEYGKTKESGIPFTMVRAAKPGLLPKGYATLEGLEHATLFYGTYADLKVHLLSFCDTDKLIDLKKSATKSTNKYTDIYLLNGIYA